MLRRIAFNTATGASARFASLGISFLTTPILVTHLGAEGFGTPAIVASLPAFIGLVDFGVGPGLVKYPTEQWEIGGKRGVRNVITPGVCFAWRRSFTCGMAAGAKGRRLALSFQGRTGCDLNRDPADVFIVSGLVGVLSARLVSLQRTREYWLSSPEARFCGLAASARDRADILAACRNRLSLDVATAGGARPHALSRVGLALESRAELYGDRRAGRGRAVSSACSNPASIPAPPPGTGALIKDAMLGVALRPLLVGSGK